MHAYYMRAYNSSVHTAFAAGRMILVRMSLKTLGKSYWVRNACAGWIRTHSGAAPGRAISSILGLFARNRLLQYAVSFPLRQYLFPLESSGAEIEEKHVSQQEYAGQNDQVRHIQLNHADFCHHVDDDEREEQHSGELLHCPDITCTGGQDDGQLDREYAGKRRKEKEDNSEAPIGIVEIPQPGTG